MANRRLSDYQGAKRDLGLEHVSNTPDDEKPLSVAMQQALATKMDAEPETDLVLLYTIAKET